LAVYSPELVEFVEVVVASGLIALAALTVASLIGFTVAFGLFRERVAVPKPLDLSAAVSAQTAEPRSTLPAGSRRASEHAPMVAG
jgi:ABC-type spermidine/putrescine transport system permease subunit II